MTTPRPDVLDDLIARLEAAEGPDREIDARIWAEMDGRDVVHRPDAPIGDCHCGRSRRAPHDECVLWVRRGDAWTNFIGGPTTRPTASADAALALVEHAMPGVFYLLAKGRTRADEPLYAFQLMFGTGEILGDAEHVELGLAICLALCRALRQEASHG